MNLYKYLNQIKNLRIPTFLGNDKNLFENLSWEILNNIIETSDIKNNNILLLKDFVNSEKEVILSDYSYIINHCLDEFSIHIKDINIYDFILNKICIDYSNKFNSKISLDLEIGTKNSNAYGLGKKIQNILVFQKYGSSIWETCKENNKLNEINFDLFSDSMNEFKMKEGDLLYIPSNFYRRKRIESDNYMFIYINIYPINAFLLLNSILKIINFDSKISLPIDYQSNEKYLFLYNLKKDFKEILENTQVRNRLLSNLKIDIEPIDIKKIWNIKN